MPVATETVFFHLKPGVNVTEPGSPDAEQLKKVFSMTAKNPGFIKQFWGLQMEEPEILVWSTVHSNLTGGADTAREAPVTEFCFFMISKDSSEEQKSAVEDAFLNLVKMCSDQGTAMAFASGWTLEDWKHEKANSGDAISLQALIGWPSKEDHMNLREISEFGEAAKPLRSVVLPAIPGKSMFHVNLPGKRT